jgi:hypothetical protein
MKIFSKKLRGRKGFVLIYMVFALMTLIPVVGLAIDFSVMYNVKARLQRAGDAGAIGAGSMVQRSTDVTDPVQNALLKDAVLRFFRANLTPVPWNSVQTAYNVDITQDATTKIRTIQLDATYNVPMLFLRVVGISNATVAVRSIAKIRFVNLMIVVDRSGSVQRTGTVPGPSGTNPAVIKQALTDFVATPPPNSVFVDGRDVVGMVSFGGNWKLDYAPTTSFQTASPAIGSAINNLYFDTSNSTNTGEGLYQAWYQLTQLNQTGALNVILLITDGRPSAFTASFPIKATASCTNKSNRAGFVGASVGLPYPPATTANRESGIFIVWPPPPVGTLENATANLVTPNANCSFVGGSHNNLSDIATIPALVGPVQNTTGLNAPYQTTFASTTGYSRALGGGSNPDDSRAVRYAAVNYADNVATAIRTDTTFKPVIYAVGLNFDPATYPTEEPLDKDWLARAANDFNYRDSITGLRVYQSNQTQGKYYDVTYSGLKAALQDITGQILRLAAN